MSAILSIMSPVTHGLDHLPQVETREAYFLSPPYELRSLLLNLQRHLCYSTHIRTIHTCNLTRPPLRLLPSGPSFNFLALFPHLLYKLTWLTPLSHFLPSKSFPMHQASCLVTSAGLCPSGVPVLDVCPHLLA